MAALVIIALVFLAIVVWVVIQLISASASAPDTAVEHPDESDRREAARWADIDRAVRALIEEFDIWKRQSGPLDSVAVEVGVSRHIMYRESALLVVASLEDAVERSVLPDKAAICLELSSRCTRDLAEEAQLVRGALGQYRSLLTNGRERRQLDGLALANLFASRSGVPASRAHDLALTLHGLMMRAGLLRLDELKSPQR